jgi:hypothetical protein
MSAKSPSRPLVVPAVLLLPLCLFVLFLFLADRLLPQETQRLWWWAGLQLHEFPVSYRFLAALIPLVPLLMPEESMLRFFTACGRARDWLRQNLGHPAVAVPVVALLLWCLRSTSLRIGDAQFYIADLIPREAFSERGIVLSYDSIGATLFYSLGYRFSHMFMAFPAITWYNLFGLLCLGAFLWWFWSNRHKQRTLGSGAVLAILLAGNWSQTTMGAPEHYGQVFLCAAAFAILAVECLRGREPLWKPCLAFAIGAFFHLIIGWLLPALLYLVAVRWRKEDPNGRALVLCALFIPAFLTGYLAYFFGFDLSEMFSGKASSGKPIFLMSPDDPWIGKHYQYATFDIRHLAHILQEMILMGWPGIVVLVTGAPLLAWSRLRRDQPFLFLLFFLAGTLLLNLLWNPNLEFWRDQDLFSIVGLALCLLGAYALVGPPGEGLSRLTRLRLLTAALAGGIAWRVAVVLWHSLLTNNYYDPQIVTITLPFGL